MIRDTPATLERTSAPYTHILSAHHPPTPTTGIFLTMMRTRSIHRYGPLLSRPENAKESCVSSNSTLREQTMPAVILNMHLNCSSQKDSQTNQGTIMALPPSTRTHRMSTRPDRHLRMPTMTATTSSRPLQMRSQPPSPAPDTRTLDR